MKVKTSECYVLEKRVHVTWGWFWQLVRVYENQDEADREATILGTGKDGFANAVVVVREYIKKTKAEAAVIAKRVELGIK